MTFAQSELAARPAGHDSKPARGPGGAARLGGTLRLMLGVAAILALAVIGAIGDKPATPTPESVSDDNGAVTATESGQAPAFDGRGKWSGYAR